VRIGIAHLTVLCLLVSAAARGEDVFAPTWRGAVGAATATWDTWTGVPDGFTLADDFQCRPHSLNWPKAWAVDVSHTYYDSDTVEVTGAPGRPGILQLVGNQSGDYLLFQLDNYGLATKKNNVRIQVTYQLHEMIGAFEFRAWPNSSVDPADWNASSRKGKFKGYVMHHDESETSPPYVTEYYDFTLGTFVDKEVIALYAPEYINRIDQVIIDTFNFNPRRVVQDELENMPVGIVESGPDRVAGFDITGVLGETDQQTSIIDDGGGNRALRMMDLGEEGNGDSAVSLKKSVQVDSFLSIDLSYRFLTEGKLDILVDGQVVDTIWSPESGEGRDSYARYSEWFDVGSGEKELEIRLSNIGDPEILLDNFDISTLPEPTTLCLLALSGLAIYRRRR